MLFGVTFLLDGVARILFGVALLDANPRLSAYLLSRVKARPMRPSTGGHDQSPQAKPDGRIVQRATRLRWDSVLLSARQTAAIRLGVFDRS